MPHQKRLTQPVDHAVVVGVRLSSQMYNDVENIYFDRNQYVRSRSLVIRMLLESALKNLDGIEPLIARQKEIARVNDHSAHDCAVELPADLFNRVEEFRWGRRIFKRATALRILLMHAFALPTSSE